MRHRKLKRVCSGLAQMPRDWAAFASLAPRAKAKLLVRLALPALVVLAFLATLVANAPGRHHQGHGGTAAQTKFFTWEFEYGEAPEEEVTPHLLSNHFQKGRHTLNPTPA